jgi:peroxiredoxin
MQVGDSLPLFTLPDQDWNNFQSESLLGKRSVIFFYPKD